MKRQIKETSIRGRRGPQRVITYGYGTQVIGLDVIRVVEPDERFCIVQSKSGISMGIYFASYIKAVKFANKYLKGFDFTRNTKEMELDKDLYKCIKNARDKEGL